MLYFNTLPKVLTPDQNGNYILMTNILTRAKLIEELQNNPMLFYTYNIQDGDTPEIVAEKYYDDPYKYWIVLYSNQIMDPIWNWPLNYEQFLDYINSKYATEADDAGKTPYEYTNTTVYAYQKIITTIDSYSEISTEKIIPLDLTAYNSFVETNNTYTLPSGLTCSVRNTKRSVSLYDYEYDLNESRRGIKVMDKNYVNQMEEQLKTVMSS
jgi:hypothetical protein